MREHLRRDVSSDTHDCLVARLVLSQFRNRMMTQIMEAEPVRRAFNFADVGAALTISGFFAGLLQLAHNWGSLSSWLSYAMRFARFERLRLRGLFLQFVPHSPHARGVFGSNDVRRDISHLVHRPDLDLGAPIERSALKPFHRLFH